MPACSECQKYVYTIPEGKLETYEVDGGKLPVLRELGPPCDQCPKKGPQNEKRYTLSNRNWQAFSLYQKIKATRGLCRIHPKVADNAIFGELMWRVQRSIESGKSAAKAAAYQRAKEKAEQNRG